MKAPEIVSQGRKRARPAHVMAKCEERFPQPVFHRTKAKIVRVKENKGIDKRYCGGQKTN